MPESTPIECPFCQLPAERVLEANAHALAVFDAFPVADGHTLVVPRRHVAGWFDLTEAEVVAVHELLCRMKERLDRALAPTEPACTANIGAAAGQTVFHVHVHLVPRYAGDVPDPIGGVRNIIPGRGRYSGPPTAS